MFHLIVELVVREQCVPFVEEESPQRFPFFRARADCVKTLEVVFYVEVYQVIFHRERVGAVFQELEKLGVGCFIHFMKVFPLRRVVGVEILQGGLRVTKIPVNVRIQFFGTDNQVVQLFVVHIVGYSLQFFIINVLQVFEPNTLCSLVHGHER